MYRLSFAIALSVVSLITYLGNNAQLQAVEPSKQIAYVLSVKHMCCAKESVPAIKELSKVSGVGRVSVNYANRTLLVEPSNMMPSPKAIWEAAERVRIEPMRLATPEGEVFKSRPRR